MSKKEVTLTEFMTATAEEPEGRPKVAASRRGKKAWVVYLDPRTARRLRVVAAITERSMQALGEEAADVIIERYGKADAIGGEAAFG